MSNYNSSSEIDYSKNSKHFEFNSETTLDILEDTKNEMTTSVLLKEPNIEEYKNMNYSEYVKNVTIYGSQMLDNSSSVLESNIKYKKSNKDEKDNTNLSLSKSSNNKLLESIKKYSPYAVLALITIGVSTLLYKKITKNSK